jgi:hypothetical protein
MQHKPFIVIFALVAALAAWPAAAHAAFAPRLALTVDPATPHSTPALDATVTENAGDTPPRRFTLSFPAGFRLRHPSGVKTCTVRQRRAERCLRASEIGSILAITPTGVRMRGTVNLAAHGSHRQIVAMVHSAAGVPDFSFVGYTKVVPAGGSQVTLDGLPNLPLASLTVRLTGGPRGLVRTPGACGDQMVQGLLTSQLNEMAVGLSPVSISGC